MSTDAPATGPRRTDRPLDEAGVATAIRRAAERGTTVRPTGAGGRAPGPLVRTDEVLLDASALTGVARIGGAAGSGDEDTVRVRAGETLADLCTALAASGRALATVPDPPRATIAGAIGLGMTGGVPRGTSLSDQVRAVRLVDGRGTVREVTGGPELDAVRCGLGAFGVVTSVELRTVPLQRLRVGEEQTRVDDVLADDLFSAYAWTECDVAVHTGQAVLRWAEPETPETAGAAAEPPERAGWGQAVSRLASSWWQSRSSWPPPQRWTPGTVGPPHQVLPDPQPWDPDLAEWAVPRAALGSVLRELGAAAAARGHELRPVRVRTGAAETGLLHPASGRDTAYLRIRARGPAEEPLRRLACAVLEDADGRPCWTTRHEWGPDELAVAYPGWAAFAEVRDRFDPDRRFTDPYLSAVLGP
ncbi:D-arabinono-1,4-lactone oxidase [Pseudonocardia sp. HH130630-07]|uniref:D-arabinono-1,4-lactone oxidase n=1 Tax=Pseudonocardia sp. HH130630-07 TaxID=1690815 RepID=UPI0018D49647|nr:D-arabinono-1,4-lactone oxidase [Pseudonocardia sp. HH130630-07]